MEWYSFLFTNAVAVAILGFISCLVNILLYKIGHSAKIGATLNFVFTILPLIYLITSDFSPVLVEGRINELTAGVFTLCSVALTFSFSSLFVGASNGDDLGYATKATVSTVAPIATVAMVLQFFARSSYWPAYLIVGLSFLICILVWATGN